MTINTISPRSQDTDFFSAGEEDADNMMLDAGDHTTVAAGMKVPAATVNSLASRLKSTKITMKPKRPPMTTTFLQLLHPFNMTKYQDTNRRNWIVNIEVHLLSCTVQEDIEALLELWSDLVFVNSICEINSFRFQYFICYSLKFVLFIDRIKTKEQRAILLLLLIAI